MRRVGVMSWDQMNWLFPDFEDTNLIYHGTDSDALLSIFENGLIAGYDPDPEDQHHTIYETHIRYRPDHIPEWVDPGRCIFGYLNRTRQGSTEPIQNAAVVQAVLGISAISSITQRTWVCCSQFSDWVYCPSEAGYFDTEAREQYYRTVIEPTCSGAYWQTSLGFSEHLAVRHDQLLHMQGYQELLICRDKIMPEHLSLQAFRIKGSNGIREVVRSDCPAIFESVEDRLHRHQSIKDALASITEFASTA